MTPSRVLSDVNLMMIRVKEKYADLQAPFRRKGCTWPPAGETWGKKEANKIVFKVHVVHLHTHEKAEVIGNPLGLVVMLHYALFI